MKTPLIYLTLILTGVLLAAETQKTQPEKPEKPENAKAIVLAKKAVEKQVVLPMTRHDRPMSRIGPIRPSVHYDKLVEVKGEKRLPFTVRQHRGATVSGYVRLSDQMVALTKTEALQVQVPPRQPLPTFEPVDGQRFRP